MEQWKQDRRVSSDRAVSREPPAVAADAADMDFECCFGTSVPIFAGKPVVPRRGFAKHGDDPTPYKRSEARPLLARTQARTFAHAKRPPRQRLTCVLGMLNSLGVRVPWPT